MLVEVSQKLLSNALQQIAPAVSAKTIIPILGGIKLQAESSGLTLTAGHVGMMLQYDIPCDQDDVIVHRSGSIVIPSRYFVDIIRNLPVGLVKIEIKNDLHICMQSGKAIYHLCGMDAEEYPKVAEMDPHSRLHFSNDHLKHLIRRVAFAVSTSESRPILTGVSCELGGDYLKLIATDGIRLSSQTTHTYTTVQRTTDATNFIIPGKHLSDFSKMLHDEQATTDISIGDHTILFKTKNLVMQSSLVEGTYPSLDKVTPETVSTEITVDSLALLRTLERVTLLAGESHVVKLHVTSDHSIQLSSRTAEIGDVVEEVEIEELCGDPITISFNGKYMIDIMRAVDCNKVKLNFFGKWNPILVQPTDSTTSLYIITAIRTHQ